MIGSSSHHGTKTLAGTLKEAFQTNMTQHRPRFTGLDALGNKSQQRGVGPLQGAEREV